MRATMVLGVLLASLPVVVEVPATLDSGGGEGGETRITLLGGGGRHAIIDRGCEGQVLATHPARFRQAGASIEHRFPSDLALGVRGGTIHDLRDFRNTMPDYSTYPYRDSLVTVRFESRSSYVNPYLALESPQVGMGAGWTWANRGSRPELSNGERMTFHVRIGREDRRYFKLSHMESVPRWTGGTIDLGFGGQPHPRWDLYAGLSGGEPFDGPGLSLKADCRVHPHWLVAGRARVGESGGEGQFGLALGLTYASRAPAARPDAAGREESDQP